MASSSLHHDLVVLTADKNTEFVLRGLLSRPRALSIRPISFTTLPHPEQDPGCYLHAPELLRLYLRSYDHALVLLDRVGSGREELSREQLEEDLESRLRLQWSDRVAAIVLDPEIETWVWSDSPHVDEVLGWKGRSPALREWLVESGRLSKGASKPGDPKEAVERALRLARRKRSSSLYQQLAERVSFQRCTDPAFAKLCQTLQRWFPAGR